MAFFSSPNVIFSWSVIQLNKCGTNSRWQRHQFELFADDYEKKDEKFTEINEFIVCYGVRIMCIECGTVEIISIINAAHIQHK